MLYYCDNIINNVALGMPKSMDLHTLREYGITSDTIRSIIGGNMLEIANSDKINDTDIDYSTKLAIFTDGSALNNSKNAPAGWAMWIPTAGMLRYGSMYGTNNQAELEAIRTALYQLYTNFDKCNKLGDIDTVHILSDSEYSIKVVTGINKPKINAEKILACRIYIRDIKKKYNINVVFTHVNAHTGGSDYLSINNDIVDKKARECAKKARGDEVLKLLLNDN